MNPSALSFFPKFLLSETTGSDLTPKLQVFDETPYVANNIALDKVAGVILSAKRENVSFYANTDFDDPDVTLDPAANVKVDLPVDATDNALYGDFEFQYKVRVYNEFTDNNNNEEIPTMAGFGLKSIVTTIGTSVTAIGAGLQLSEIIVMADPGNAGSLYLGGSDVSSSNGILLSETEPLKLSMILTSGFTDSYLLAKCYAIGTDSGDKIRVLYAVADSSAV